MLHVRGSANAGERNFQKVFEDWLKTCHKDLDKRIRFRDIAAADVQVAEPVLCMRCSILRLTHLKSPAMCSHGTLHSFAS